MSFLTTYVINITEFNPSDIDHMLKILKGSVRFYPGYRTDKEPSVMAPSLDATPLNEQIIRDEPSRIDFILGNDIAKEIPTIKEIKQMTPRIDDQPKR